MRHRIYFHLVWTTRERAHLIDAEVATFLARYLQAVCTQERSTIVAIGIVKDHVHLLVRCHPLTSLPNLVQRLKGGSASLANKERHAKTQELKWTSGYNVESVSPNTIDDVVTYVTTQASRHPDRAIPDWPGVEPCMEALAPETFDVQKRLRVSRRMVGD